MSFFGDLFKKKPPVEVHDPAFGCLSFTNGMWSFIPTTPGTGFMITVDAQEAGPTEGQRDLFQRIRSSLPKFECQARDFVQLRLGQTVDATQLSVYSVAIGNDDETAGQQFVLELSDDDATVVHRIRFRAGEPVDYGFDD